MSAHVDAHEGNTYLRSEHTHTHTCLHTLNRDVGIRTLGKQDHTPAHARKPHVAPESHLAIGTLPQYPSSPYVLRHATCTRMFMAQPFSLRFEPRKLSATKNVWPGSRQRSTPLWALGPGPAAAASTRRRGRAPNRPEIRRVPQNVWLWLQMRAG